MQGAQTLSLVVTYAMHIMTRCAGTIAGLLKVRLSELHDIVMRVL